MKNLQYSSQWYLYGLLLATTSLACSLIQPSAPNENLPPSRTPLPTFTATSPADVANFSLPTSTPIPPPTESPTPSPTALPTNTPVPEDTTSAEEREGEEAPAETTGGEGADEADESENETKNLEPEPPPPTAPPPPAPTDPPPAEPAPGDHGVLGQLTLRDGRNTYGVGEKVFVKIEATHTEPGQRPFGILGLNTSAGAFQTSWSSGVIDGTFTHEDGVAFSAPGNHTIWLSICFSDEQTCQGSDGEWERFEPGVEVVIQ